MDRWFVFRDRTSFWTPNHSAGNRWVSNTQALDIHTGPDGNIYVAIERFSNLGQLVRLVPVNK